MKPTRNLILAHLLLLFSLSAPAAEINPGRILVAPKIDRAAGTAEVHRGKGRRVLKRFPEIRNVEVIELAPGEDALAAVREYQASGHVEFAEPDYIVRIAVTPSDPYYNANYQWHLHNAPDVVGLPAGDINAPEGWDIRHDAPGVVVAMIDTGIRQTHEDLAGNLWVNPREIAGNGLDDDGNGIIDDAHGFNAITGTGNPEDDDGHGTHVAGIIGAQGNNSKGVAGVAWKVQLMALKFIGADGRGNTSDAIECLNYAVKNGAHVVNASFGGGEFSTTFQLAIQAARTAGVVLVVAAGNESANLDVTPSYPANYNVDNIVTVAATTSYDLFDATYSNFGARSVDLGAPGTSIFSTYRHSNSSYEYSTGTSMASPVVAGVVALLRAQFPADTYAHTIQRLLGTVDALPTLTGKTVTGGRVNLQRALSPFVGAGFTPSAVAGIFPLTVRFTNESFGEITGYTWNFGDGSAAETNASPTHVFNAEGSYPVTLTVAGLNGLLATITQTVTAFSGYSLREGTYEWIPTTGMTALALPDNATSAAQEIGFPFNFYGQVKSQLYVGSNGLLGFDPAGMTSSSNANLPSAATPNGMICPYWDNLNPASAGAVYAGTVGESPNRRFVVSWVDVLRNSSSDRMTFQAVLAETTGLIQFNYLEVNPTSNRGGGARASIGIEDPSGTLAVKHGFDGTPNRVTNAQSIVFVPSAVRGEWRFNLPTLAAGVVRIDLSAYVGETFLIEGSSDLVTWMESARGTVGASGLVPVTEVANGTRFFRAQIVR